MHPLGYGFIKGTRGFELTQSGWRELKKMSDERIIETQSAPAWQLPAIVVLGLVGIVGVWFGWSASAKLDSTKQDVAAQLKTEQQSVQQDMTSLKDRIAQDEQANNELKGDLKVVTGKLKITQGQLKKAREESTKMNSDTVDKITALDTDVKGQLATKASNDDVKTVDTKVVGVKGDLDQTRKDLDLARSEMGTLIARNHDEIDYLRRQGERDYIEFAIAGKNKPQKVGNVTVELKGTNQKHNQFNLALTVEDKRYDKKNRAINEPMFFYTSGTKLPEELVINKVSKDQISGYVSIPKANSQQQPQAQAESSKSGK